MNVLKFPIARITLIFLAGILIAYSQKPSLILTASFLFSSLFCSIISFFLFDKFKANKTIFGISAFCLAFSIGVTTQVIHTTVFEKTHYIYQKNLANTYCDFEIIITDKLKSTAFNNRFVATISKINEQSSCGKLIVNIPNDSTIKPIIVGSKLSVKGQFLLNQKTKNPNQFDYAEYLEHQQIYGQLYAQVSDIRISSEVKKDVWYYAAQFRTKIIRNLEAHHFHKKELNVIIALILGQQQDIAADVIQDYQYAGAVHVLSVSGLHVGFILLFINFILKPLPNNKNGAIIKLIITLLSLWSFGLVAGFAPSILRSVTMFSFVTVGHYLRRTVNIYHTLLVSILLILLFKPAFLFDVGFQLSYVSLFFIVWLQPVFSRIWIPSNKIFKYFWDILTVSFAAQIGALPLSIYYFHQFPGLFFITNLVILPGMGIILALGVLVMLMAAIGYVPYYPMKSLEWSIYILNKTINWIASFQEFVIQNISFNSYLLYSSYFMIVAVFIAIKKPTFQKIIFGLISIITFQCAFLMTKYQCQTENELIVFHLKKQTLINARVGEQATIYTSDTIDSKRQDVLLNNYLVANFSKLKAKKPLPNYLIFGNKKILILNQTAFYPENVKIDLLLISHSPKLNLDRFLKNCKPTVIIADGSNFKSYIESWNATCFEKKIPFHATADNGFYKID